MALEQFESYLIYTAKTGPILKVYAEEVVKNL